MAFALVPDAVRTVLTAEHFQGREGCSWRALSADANAGPAVTEPWLLAGTTRVVTCGTDPEVLLEAGLRNGVPHHLVASGALGPNQDAAAWLKRQEGLLFVTLPASRGAVTPVPPQGVVRAHSMLQVKRLAAAMGLWPHYPPDNAGRQGVTKAATVSVLSLPAHWLAKEAGVLAGTVAFGDAGNLTAAAAAALGVEGPVQPIPSLVLDMSAPWAPQEAVSAAFQRAVALLALLPLVVLVSLSSLLGAARELQTHDASGGAVAAGLAPVLGGAGPADGKPPRIRCSRATWIGDLARAGVQVGSTWLIGPGGRVAIAQGWPLAPADGVPPPPHGAKAQAARWFRRRWVIVPAGAVCDVIGGTVTLAGAEATAWPCLRVTLAPFSGPASSDAASAAMRALAADLGISEAGEAAGDDSSAIAAACGAKGLRLDHERRTVTVLLPWGAVPDERAAQLTEAIRGVGGDAGRFGFSWRRAAYRTWARGEAGMGAALSKPLGPHAAWRAVAIASLPSAADDAAWSTFPRTRPASATVRQALALRTRVLRATDCRGLPACPVDGRSLLPGARAVAWPCPSGHFVAADCASLWAEQSSHCPACKFSAEAFLGSAFPNLSAWAEGKAAVPWGGDEGAQDPVPSPPAVTPFVAALTPLGGQPSLSWAEVSAADAAVPAAASSDDDPATARQGRRQA